MVGVMTLTFFLIRLSGDPAAFFVNIDLEWDEDRIELELDYARRRLGLDQPLPIQYVNYLWRIVRLDFRESFRYQASTREVVFERLPLTIQLGAAQYVFAIFTGLPLGWPGIGQLFVQSMSVRDYPVVFMLTVLLGTITAFRNGMCSCSSCWTSSTR